MRRTINFARRFMACVLPGLLLLAAVCAGAAELRVKTLKGHGDSDVWAVAFSPDGKYLASAGADSKVQVWKTQNFEQLKTLSGHTKPVTSLSFSPDGKYIASGGRDSTVVIAHTDGSGSPVTLTGHQKAVFSVAFSRDGQYLASGGLDSTIRIWRAPSWQLEKTLSIPKSVFSVAFSSDSKFLACGSEDGLVRVWDAGKWELLRSLEGHSNFVWNVAFSPDGRYLASAGRDNSVRVWTMSDYSLAKNLETHSPMMSVAFSTDSRYLATAGEDKMVRMWQISDWKQYAVLQGHDGNVDWVAFSPDGHLVATASEDDTVRIWRTPWEASRAEEEAQTRQAEADYASHFASGNDLLNGARGFMAFMQQRRAAEEFQAAVAAKDTPEAREKLERASASAKKGMAVAVTAGLALLLVVGGALFVVLSARRKRFLQGNLPEMFRNAVAAEKLDDAYGYFVKFRFLGGGIDRIAPESLAVLLAHKDRFPSMAGEKYPSSFYPVFARQMASSGNFAGALEMYEKYKGMDPGADKLAASFPAEELVSFYIGAGQLDRLAALATGTDMALKTAKLLVEKEKKAEALSLLVTSTTFLREADLPPDQAVHAVEFLCGLGKPEDLVKLLSSWHYPARVYSAAAAWLGSQKKHAEAITVIETGNAHYPKQLPAADYRLLVDSYAAVNKLADANPDLFPEDQKYQVVEALMRGGQNDAALRVLAHRPRPQWTDKDYSLCLQLYTRLDMYELAEEMVTQVTAQKSVSDFPEFYYDFAVYCEKTGKATRAMEVYKEFLVKGITFRDVLLRYQNLREKFGAADPKTTAPQVAPQAVPVPAAVASAEPVAVPAAAPQASAAPAPQAAPAPEKTTAPAPASAPQENARIIAAASKTERLQADAIRVSRLKGGKMELLSEIGRGGMGIVYSVFDKSLNRKVALKRMRDELYVSKKEVAKFLNEARLVAQLNHPNIVIVYEIIEEEDMAFIFFEFIDGQSLEQLLEVQSKGMQLNEAVRVIEQICNGLSYAHNHNIIHRDLKPSNIMLAHDGLVKLTDFGIARVAKDTILRLTGTSTGTLAYMAPEQELGTFDPRSDIYSLGVIIYEMLTGQLPFRGPNFYLQKEKMIYRTVGEMLPELPREMDDIVNKCLQADPEKRYASVDELLRDLVGRV